MVSTERRHDIDWLRVIAIAFLLIYHISIVFQPWGFLIGFIQSEDTSSAFWIPMSMLNVWRIPLLFFVSGIGMFFALRKRDWKQLLLDRGKRILLPLIFGSLAIVPIHVFILQKYYNFDLQYVPGVGHLWFLAYICIYVLQMIGFAFVDKSFNNAFFNFFRKVLSRPYLLYLFIIPFILEAELASPEYFATYVGNSHGFLIGMLAFFFGFVFAASGDVFWAAVDKMKYLSLAIASTLFLIRLFAYDTNAPYYQISIESMNWLFAVFGFAYRYLNKPGKLLDYLSQSVYPVYIVHMIFLFLAAYLILPLGLSIELDIILIVLITFVGSFGSYELVIKRVGFLRPLFGMKSVKRNKQNRKLAGETI